MCAERSDVESSCRVDILGTEVSAAPRAAARAYVERAVAERAAIYVCPANVHSVILGVDDAEYRGQVNRAGWVLADGMPLVWIARRRGVSAERAHGDDLMLELCEKHREWRHFLFGGRPLQPERVAEELARRFPGLVVAGTLATPARPPRGEESERAVAAIRAARADVVWVGMGTPAQDIWMSEQAAAVGVPMIGVGSAFDLLAGRTRPTPGWMKRAGLQWLFRLVQEPRRLARRYLFENPRFLVRIALESARGRSAPTSSSRRKPVG